jgi:hypothetical protein
MLDTLKHRATIGQMRASPRRFITRACVVCEWSGAAVEVQPVDIADCPWCHAPARVVREEWLFDATELRKQAAHFGRIGGLKGGPARAERLSSRKRSEIARRAAAARWRRT